MRIQVRLYAGLNDHLPEGMRQRDIDLDLDGAVSIGELLERLRVPLSSVDLILSGGLPASPDDEVADGTRVSVFPVFESFDVSSVRAGRSWS